MFADENIKISGKHLICDFKNINLDIINDIEKVKSILDSICNDYNYTVLGKIEHKFEPQGFTLLYLLSESHLSIHTFPERKTVAFDLYTCRAYDNNNVYNEIHKKLLNLFGAETENPIIIDRKFM